MSGRTKRILYYIADAALFLIFGVGMLLLPLFVPTRAEFSFENVQLWKYLSGLAFIVLGLPVLLHEVGHLLFGLLAGMKLARFRFYPFTREVAGETAMYPKNAKHVKGKFFALTLGGAVFNIALGVALLLLWLLLPAHPMVYGALSGFVFYEGLRALLPAELPAGKTDGAVLLGLIKNRPEEQVMLRVLTAQGILYRSSFAAVPRELLFCAPVVREDAPAYHALLLLRAQFLLAAGEEEAAKGELSRLKELEEYLPEEESEELSRYCALFDGEFRAKKGGLFGVNALEEQLAQKMPRAEEAPRAEKTP